MVVDNKMRMINSDILQISTLSNMATSNVTVEVDPHFM